jgi:hypothetical protein
VKGFDKSLLDSLVGTRVRLPGHFEGQVVIESARALGSGVELRVRLASGHLDEAVLSGDDVDGLLDTRPGEPETLRPVDADKLLAASAGKPAR